MQTNEYDDGKSRLALRLQNVRRNLVTVASNRRPGWQSALLAAERVRSGSAVTVGWLKRGSRRSLQDRYQCAADLMATCVRSHFRPTLK